MSEMRFRGNSASLNYPYFDADVYKTDEGTCYLKSCGVAMIARTATNLETARGFLDGFDSELGFDAYLDDDRIEDAAQVVKFAGQLCYMSFSEKRSRNSDAKKYLDHIKELGHGSVVEHASFTFLFYGVDRSVTHELVRHRAGMSYSQVSQRYVDGSKLRFVERPEIQPERIPDGSWDDLGWKARMQHDDFLARIDRARSEYETSAYDMKTSRALGHPMLQGGSATELRKHLNQAARELLPNCTEAPIVVSGNGRAWRGFLDQRATKHADVPIRDAAVKTLKLLQYSAPLLFDDYEIVTLEDGTEAAEAVWRKI